MKPLLTGIGTPSLNASLAKGSDPLNTVHVINKLLTPDDGRVTFCPHAKDTKDGNMVGGDDGRARFGSPIRI